MILKKVFSFYGNLLGVIFRCLFNFLDGFLVFFDFWGVRGISFYLMILFFLKLKLKLKLKDFCVYKRDI